MGAFIDVVFSYKSGTHVFRSPTTRLSYNQLLRYNFYSETEAPLRNTPIKRRSEVLPHLQEPSRVASSATSRGKYHLQCNDPFDKCY